MSAIAPEIWAPSHEAERRTAPSRRSTDDAQRARTARTAELDHARSSRWLFSFDGWFVDVADEGFVLA